ncbi:MAG: LuxR C-terminal-related transcriptional regulator [Nitrospirales bacterium]
MARVRPAKCEVSIPEKEPSGGWGELLGNSAHKIFIWDKDGIYRDCQFPNPVYGHFLGGTTLKGMRVAEVLDEAEAKVVLKGIHQSLVLRQPTQTEWVWTNTAGTFVTRIRFFPILDLVMGVVNDRPFSQQDLSAEGFPNNGRKQTSQFTSLQLTLRERQIVEEVRSGKTNKQIAKTLLITHRTVKFHLSNIFVKLHISSREALQGSKVAAWRASRKSQDALQAFSHKEHGVSASRLLKKTSNSE